MPKCKITGKKPLVGYRVSQAHNKTKMRQQPNVQSKRVWDDDQGKYVRVRVSTRALRTIEKNGLSTVLKSVR
jgi:large subunit ribosomal protein L28